MCWRERESDRDQEYMTLFLNDSFSRNLTICNFMMNCRYQLLWFKAYLEKWLSIFSVFVSFLDDCHVGQ